MHSTRTIYISLGDIENNENKLEAAEKSDANKPIVESEQELREYKEACEKIFQQSYKDYVSIKKAWVYFGEDGEQTDKYGQPSIGQEAAEKSDANKPKIESEQEPIEYKEACENIFEQSQKEYVALKKAWVYVGEDGEETDKYGQPSIGYKP